MMQYQTAHTAPESVESRAPRKAKPEYVDETPRRPRRTKHESAAEDALGHHFVSVISYEHPVPRNFHDNRGVLPMHVEVNADWRQSGLVFDRQQPVYRAVRLEVLGVRSKEAANRLKAALDEALNGRETHEESPGLRHRFRNTVDFGRFEAWWGPLLYGALVACSGGVTPVEVFSRADHEALVAARVARVMARAGRGA